MCRRADILVVAAGIPGLIGAAAVTPVPGGVGPMTIAMLLANTLTAARRQQGFGVP